MTQDSRDNSNFRHNCTNRFVDVDFNTLDIMFNLQTWVIVLDFFGIGSGPSRVPKSAPVTRKVHPRPGQQLPQVGVVVLNLPLNSIYTVFASSEDPRSAAFSSPIPKTPEVAAAGARYHDPSK